MSLIKRIRRAIDTRTKPLGDLDGPMEDTSGWSHVYVIGRSGSFNLQPPAVERGRREYEHRGLPYYVKQMVRNSKNRYYESTLSGIQLPAYHNVNVNRFVCYDFFGTFFSPLLSTQGEKSPRFSFKFQDGVFVPVFEKKTEEEAIKRSKRVIDFFLNPRNVENYEFALAEIDGAYPESEEESEELLRSFNFTFAYS